MKLFTAIVALLVVPAALAQSTPSPTPTPVSVTFDQVYDNGSNSVDIVACSPGPPNGLNAFSNFSSLPNFPNIGGVFAITGFNSPFCGSCWLLTFENTSINIFGIDTAGPNGFNIALEAMNQLTNNTAEFLGRVNATAVQVNQTECEAGSQGKKGTPTTKGTPTAKGLHP